MGRMMKTDGGSLTLRFSGGGAAGGFISVADPLGNVRGCCDKPEAELPPNREGKLDVGGVVGRSGDMYVIRDYGFGEPYVGHSKIVSGEIAEDITNYYAVSEQTPTVCALGVRVFPDGSIKGAGGFIMQLLPGADSNEELIARLQQKIAALGSLSAHIAGGRTAADIAGLIFTSIPYSLIDEAEIEYRCNCERDKYRRALKSLGPRELAYLREGGEEAEIICRFCGTRYACSQGVGEMYYEAEAELRQQTSRSANTRFNHRPAQETR
jgi:molecular chaperone Hsp33